VNQWAVYAIRNLTEQNGRNQELIARMEEKGLADSSALESMGLEIEKQDDKLILRSVRKKPLWTKKWRTVKSLKEDFSLRIFFHSQAMKISSVLVEVCWKHYVHSQKNCQVLLLPLCCKQKDVYTFSKYLDKLTYGKRSFF